MSADKYTSYKSSVHSPYSKIQDDIDPYSPVIVEDLLQGVNEWRNIQDIIRLTFKALTDVVKAQGETLRELERQMPTRASKAELNSGLALKANISDVSRTIAEVVTNLESKPSTEDILSILKDYVLRSDFQYLLSSKASIDEVKTLLENRVSTQEFKSETTALNNRLEDFYRETNKKLANLVTQREFQALSATVDQKANLNEMMEQLESKANKQSVANALHRKANRADVEALLARKADIADVQSLLNAVDSKADAQVLDKLNQILEDKVDRSDFNLITNTLASKIDRADFEHFISTLSAHNAELKEFDKRIDLFRDDLEAYKQALNGQLNKKADAREVERLAQALAKKPDVEHTNAIIAETKHELADDFNSLRSEFIAYKRSLEENFGDRQAKNESFYDKLSEEIYKLNDQLKTILEERRNDIEETAKFVKNISNATKKEVQGITDRLFSELDEIRKAVEDLITRKVEKKEWAEIKAKLVTELEGKVDLVEVQNALNTCQADISARFSEYREEVKNMVRSHENEIYTMLSKKANLADMNTALANKADVSTVHALLGQKTSNLEYEDLKRKLDQFVHLVEDKVSFRDFETQHTHIKRILDDIQKELILKANIKDVCTLLDAKSNIDEVNKALIDIHKELDIKANQEELAQIVNDQALINESLCTENILGRWAWKSGDLKSGSLVPWEIQLANTLPDNFLWEKDKTSILTVAPGLYEVTLGFFSKKKPSIQLLVNGEPIFSAVNPASHVIHHGTKREIELSKHSSTTGLTLIDFIMLPERARISIIYNGEDGGEGFFGLKRL